MTHWSDPTVIAALIGAVVALLYTILTGFIWHATWENTRATRLVLEAAQRPYLGIARVELIKSDLLNGPIKVGAVIANVGSVPSTRVEMDLKVKYPDGTTGGMRWTPLVGQNFAVS